MDAGEIKFISDVIQDARVDAMNTTKYATLINTIMNNAELNYTGDDLRIKYDEKVFNVIQALEPENYDKVFKTLKKEKSEKIEE